VPQISPRPAARGGGGGAARAATPWTPGSPLLCSRGRSRQGCRRWTGERGTAPDNTRGSAPDALRAAVGIRQRQGRAEFYLGSSEGTQVFGLDNGVHLKVYTPGALFLSQGVCLESVFGGRSVVSGSACLLAFAGYLSLDTSIARRSKSTHSESFGGQRTSVVLQ
jgi:hypothetical protein